MADFEKNEFKFPHEAEETKNPSGINEGEEVEIEVVDDTPEVDRNRKPMKEAPAEVTEEELEKYDAGVKKRIQHLNKGFHEERRAKETAQREREEAVRIAQALVDENKKLKGSLSTGQTALIEQAKKVAESELDKAKDQFKSAYEAGDSDALLAAQEAMVAAKLKADRVANFKPAALHPEESSVQSESQTASAQPVQRLDPKVEAWRDANPWFGTNKRMTALALVVHQELLDDKVNPNSDEYYDKLNKAIRSTFPDAFNSEEEEKPVAKKSSVVAPATRSVAPKKIVLTQSQVSIAKRLGVPLEKYAKQLAEIQRNQNER